MDQNMRITLILVTWKVVLCENRATYVLVSIEIRWNGEVDASQKTRYENPLTSKRHSTWSVAHVERILCKNIFNS